MSEVHTFACRGEPAQLDGHISAGIYTMTNRITYDVQTLEPGALVELLELDATVIGGDLLRFHGYTQVGSVWW